MSFSSGPYGPSSDYGPNYNDLAPPYDQYGAFPLTGVAGLPNVTVAFPGEHWSDCVAGGTITPGSLVVPVAGGSANVAIAEAPETIVRSYVVAASGAVDPRAAIALHVVEHPDLNPGSLYNVSYGPNEIVNLPITIGQYVHTYHSGSFHLTLVTPDATYAPGDLLTWDPAAAPPVSKAALAAPLLVPNGAWKKTVVAANAFFEVQDYRPYSSDNREGIVTVRSLRSQF